MAFQPASIEAGHDPRVHLSEKEEQDAYIPEDNFLPDGSTPNIETYMYYAKIQRDKEAALTAEEDAEGGHQGSLISRVFKPSHGSDRKSVSSAHSSEKKGVASSEEGAGALVTAGEYRAASGALRTATWGSVFYLITTGMPFETSMVLISLLLKIFWVLIPRHGHFNKLDMVPVSLASWSSASWPHTVASSCGGCSLNWTRRGFPSGLSVN